MPPVARVGLNCGQAQDVSTSNTLARGVVSTLPEVSLPSGQLQSIASPVEMARRRDAKFA